MNVMIATKGSAGYVAIEQVVGNLSGKAGSFVLQHFGVMDKGEEHLQLMVVPDSGTQKLNGLSSTMTINKIKSQHGYEFNYALEACDE